MSDLLRNVYAALAEAGIRNEMPLVVGVSGGPDSLALLHVLLRVHSADQLVAAHLNHQLRHSADADAAFVTHIAAAWGVRCRFRTVNVAQLALAEGRSLEEAARFARYRFLAEVAHDIGAAYVAVGHNADDQAETVLLHVLRGSGLQGLRGMQPVADWPVDLESGNRPILQLLRPLLGVTRAAIDAYCRDHTLTPVLDETNEDVTYLRNRIRHELLPLLETYNPTIRERLTAMADVISADFELLHALETVTWQQIVLEQADEYVVLNRSAWRALPLGLRRRLLRHAVLAVRAIAGDLPLRPIELARRIAEEGHTGAQAELPGAVRLQVSYDQITIGRKGAMPQLDAPQMPTTTAVCLAVPGRVQLATGWEIVATPLAATSPDRLQWVADRWQEVVQLPVGAALWVRTRHDGERMQPLGMDGKRRKLQDVMVDAHIPAALRDRWPLVVTDDHLVWVPGVRLDQRAAIDETKRDTVFIHLHCLRSA
ncbi:MAG: tRNA lysidine(34) synthetase TilS [Anaerolineae bacterium]|nr:tRNA lysidine(34) synthetase TilS [Anaerolineae bacterium]